MGLGALLKIAKTVGKVSGVLASDDDGAPVRARKTRLTTTALVVAIFVYLGLPAELAEPLGDFLAALTE